MTMTDFTKTDLLYFERYTWKDKNSFDSETLDKNDGYEVLEFAAYFVAKHFEHPLKGDLHKIEYMLAFRVPEQMMAVNEISDFILKNWHPQP